MGQINGGGHGINRQTDTVVIALHHLSVLAEGLRTVVLQYVSEGLCPRSAPALGLVCGGVVRLTTPPQTVAVVSLS